MMCKLKTSHRRHFNTTIRLATEIADQRKKLSLLSIVGRMKKAKSPLKD